MPHLFHSGDLVEECPLLPASYPAAAKPAAESAWYRGAAMRRLGLAAGGSLVLHALFLGMVQMVGGEQTTGLPAVTVLSVSLAQLPEASGSGGNRSAMTPTAPARLQPAASLPVAVGGVAPRPAPSAPAVAIPTAGLAVDGAVPGLGAGPGAGAGMGEGRGAPGDGGAPQLAPPFYRVNPAPAYPSFARLRRQEGVVVVRVMVLADGAVGALQLEKTSGYPLLDEAALKAVRNWAFAPGRRGGIPLAMEVQVPVRFALQ